MTPEQRSQALHDGEDAALALDKLPLEGIRASIFEEWAKTDSVLDCDKRESLWHELKALDRIKARLWSLINGAKVAAFEIKQDEQNQTVRIDPYAP